MESDSCNIPLEGEEFEAFYREILREFGPGTGQKPKKRKKKTAPSGQRKRRLRNLAAVLCLECTGIAAIVFWWMVRIL